MNYNPLYENAILIAPISEEGFFNSYRQAFPKVKFDVLTIEEVEGMFALTHDEDAVLYLLEKGYPYPLAKELLIALDHMKEREYKSPKLQALIPLFEEMKKKGLLYQDALPFSFFKGRNIVIRGYSDGKRIASALESLPNISLSWDKVVPPRKDLPPYLEFEDIHQELHYLCNSIAKLLLNDVKPSDIYVVGLPAEAYMEMELMCQAYHIPFVNPSVPSLFALPFAKKVLNLFAEKGLGETLSSFEGQVLSKDERAILTNLALYGSLTLPQEKLLSILEDVYLDKKCSKQKGEGIVLVNGRYVPRGCHAFIVDFSFGKAPRLHRDASYLSDEERNELGLPSSLLLNAREEKELTALLQKPEIGYISYSASHYGTPLYPSSWGGDDIHSKKGEIFYQAEYSEQMGRMVAASLNDDFQRVRKESPYRASLNAQIPLTRPYDPQFVTFSEAGKKGDLYLSYSSLETFYKCPFAYYLLHKLHLKDEGYSFYPRLGTMLHAYLEKFEENKGDFAKAFDDIVERFDKQGPAFTAKERFLLQNIKPLFMETLEFLAEHFNNISNAKYHHEHKIELSYGDGVILKGSIDLAIESGDTPRYVSIIDFKTKGKNYDEGLLNLGLNLQLPLYAYFASREKDFKDDSLLGVYYAPIVPNQDKNDHSFKGKCEAIPGLNTFDPDPITSGLIDKKAMETVENPGDLGKRLTAIALEKLDEAIIKMRAGDFPISPLNIGDRDKSCGYCPFGDICYQRDEFRRYETGKEGEDGADE